MPPSLTPGTSQSFSGLLATDRTAVENVDLWNAAEKGDLSVLQKQTPEALRVMNKHQDTLLHFVRSALPPLPHYPSEWSDARAKAAARGQAETVRFLLDALGKGAANSVNVYSETPLHRAASLGKTEVVRTLIGAGADVNTPNSYDETPFYIACYGGHTAVVAQLLQVPRCRYRESGETNLRPVALAGVRGHAEIVKLIARHEHWQLLRLLWLGHMRGRADGSPFALLSRDLVARIARYLTAPRSI